MKMFVIVAVLLIQTCYCSSSSSVISDGLMNVLWGETRQQRFLNLHVCPGSRMFSCFDNLMSEWDSVSWTLNGKYGIASRVNNELRVNLNFNKYSPTIDKFGNLYLKDMDALLEGNITCETQLIFGNTFNMSFYDPKLCIIPTTTINSPSVTTSSSSTATSGTSVTKNTLREIVVVAGQTSSVVLLPSMGDSQAYYVYVGLGLLLCLLFMSGACGFFIYVKKSGSGRLHTLGEKDALYKTTKHHHHHHHDYY